MRGELRCPLCTQPQPWAPGPAPCPHCGVPPTFFPVLSPDVAWAGRGLWRYSALLPEVEPISLGEGGTPCVPSVRVGPALGVELWFKLEGANPTGSFKDRGAAVLVAVLKALGARKLADDSSGNAGAALAAYAARAGLPAVLFVPENASPRKLAQIRAYGAHLVTVPGPRSQATLALQRACAQDPQLVYASHNASPYFLAGLTPLAYEIWEDMGAPDHVVVPVGGGGLFLGLWYGFQVLRRLGRTERVPKMHAVQAQACAPIVDAWLKKSPQPSAVEPQATVAEGLRVAQPPRGREILRALRENGGSALAVPDEAILTAQAQLAEGEGLFVEPTSAVALAALPELVRQGVIRPGERVVVPLTGSGLKTA